MSQKSARLLRQEAAAWKAKRRQRMYIFPGSFQEADLLHKALILEVHRGGMMTGIRLSLVWPHLAVPELWEMYKGQMKVDAEVEKAMAGK